MIGEDSNRQLIQAIPLKQSMFHGVATGEDVRNYQVLVMGADGNLTVVFNNGESKALTGLLAGTAFALDPSVASVTSTAPIMMS